MQPCRAGAAVVVDIVDRDLCHAELVENALAAGRVAKAVACDPLVDIVVIDLSIKESFDSGFEPEFVIVDCSRAGSGMLYNSNGILTFAAWFDELSQANTQDVGWPGWLLLSVRHPKRSVMLQHRKAQASDWNSNVHLRLRGKVPRLVSRTYSSDIGKKPPCQGAASPTRAS